jgi:hypothetical protein
MSRCSAGLHTATTAAVRIASPARMKKNPDSPTRGTRNANAWPPSGVPTAGPRNHTPIICPLRFGGASCVVTLRPTGETHSSPKVRSRYTQAIHPRATRTPPSAVFWSQPRNRYATPVRSTPSANL